LPRSELHDFDLAQNDLRRPAALLPAFNLDGGVVTAVFNLLPGFFLL
jgi:hypothetical protein